MMIIDKFTKFILSVIAVSLCMNALNPWISPTLANANDDFAMERAIQKIAGGINKIADNIEQIVEIENDLSVFWPMMHGCENIVDLYATHIVALYATQYSDTVQDTVQPCVNGAKKVIKEVKSPQDIAITIDGHRYTVQEGNKLD